MPAHRADLLPARAQQHQQFDDGAEFTVVSGTEYGCQFVVAEHPVTRLRPHRIARVDRRIGGDQAFLHGPT